MDFILNHWKDILEIIAYVISIASIIVKVTPTLKDDSILLPVIKFVGKWLALNKFGPTDKDRPKGK